MPVPSRDADAYAVLRVEPSASQDEIRRAYRRRVRDAHPDMGGSADEFQAVRDAFEAVGDPESRARYERTLREAPAPEDPVGRAHPASPPSGYDGDSWDPASRRGRPGAPRERPAARTRSFGHPGGFARLRYLSLVREWLADPAEPSVPAAPVPPRGGRAMADRPEPYVRRIRAVAPPVTAALVALVVLVSGLGVVPAVVGLVVGAAVGLAGAGPLGSAWYRAEEPRRRAAERLQEEVLAHERALRAYPDLMAAYSARLARLEELRRRFEADAYAPDLVADVPAAAAESLRAAVAQEETARELMELGPSYAFWNGVAVPRSGDAIDHLVLGPQGLVAVESVPGGAAAAADPSARDAALRSLDRRARALAREMEVPVVGLVLSLPSGILGAAPVVLHAADDPQALPAYAVARTLLADHVAAGLPGLHAMDPERLLAVRTRLVLDARFV
ncbi:DnaJ domain-containing protein [Clavibacter michiganensis]|uniref:Chaperone protein DnaJ n=1 Tax=Clavibacter michiganensis TaxID=28447 RepID=A0A251YTW7_9MICO|nr:DnaJ domain-containing protein [Clavibacter michiganensis]OUE27691.1 Chaperone protein DnaJ [Clavibacter michiganensis]